MTQQIAPQTEVKDSTEVHPDVKVQDDNLGAYLDADLGHDESTTPEEQEQLETEREEDEAGFVVPFFRRPSTKLYGATGAVSVVVLGLFVLLARGCEGDKTSSTVAAKPLDAKDQEIALLKKQNSQIAGQLETEAQKRQRSKYLETVIPKAIPKKVPIAAKRPTNSYPQASRVSYAPIPVRETPRAVSIPPAPPAPAPNNQAPEIAALKAQLKELLAQREKPAELVAQVEETPPNDYQEVVNTEPVAPVQGGIEEVSLLSGRPAVTIAAGTEAKAKLLVPIVGTGAQVVLALTTDIKDVSGQVSIPAGSKLLGTAAIQNGIAQVNLTGAVINGQATELPATNAIAVLTDGKQPIIAKRLGGGSSGPGIGNTLLTALLGAGSAGIGQLLAPKTTQTISTINGITSQSVNPPSTMTNALLAGAGGLTTGLSSGFKAAIPTTQTTASPAMGVKAGLTLNLVFTAPIEMLTAMALPQSEPEPSVDMGEAMPIDPSIPVVNPTN